MNLQKKIFWIAKAWCKAKRLELRINNFRLYFARTVENKFSACRETRVTFSVLTRAVLDEIYFVLLTFERCQSRAFVIFVNPFQFGSRSYTFRCSARCLENSLRQLHRHSESESSRRNNATVLSASGQVLGFSRTVWSNRRIHEELWKLVRRTKCGETSQQPRKPISD